MNKIPSNAKMVFKGVIFEVWQWEQEMFDGSKQTFEMLKRPSTVRMIASWNNEVVILSQEQPGKKPYFGLPSGRVEENEDPLLAAKRELLEETGLESNDWELLVEDIFPGKLDWTIYTYVARNCRKTHSQNLDPGEKIDVKTVNYEEFLGLVDNPLFHEKDLFPIMLKAKYDENEGRLLKKKIFC